MLDGIRWAGDDTFRIDDSAVAYVGPRKLPRSAPPADAVLVTHEHPDHFNPEDVAGFAAHARAGHRSAA